jgi:hypothetical protein
MTALAILGFGSGLVSRAVHPVHTWIDGWNLDPAHNYIRGVGDIDGDGRSEAVITSDWGVGILKHDGTAFRCPFGAPRDSMFGSWRYDATARAGRDRVMAVDNFTGAAQRDLLLWSSGGMATLERTATGLSSSRIHNNGTRLGGWILNTADNRYWGAARLDSDRKAMVLTSPWGIGLISLDAGTSVVMAPVGTRFGSWTWHVDDRVALIADLDGDGQDELVVTGVLGLAVLKLVGGNLVAVANHAVGANLGGYIVEGPDKTMIADRFRPGAASDVVVSDPHGFHALTLDGSRLERRAFVASGTRIDGWIVDPTANTLLAAGDMTGDGPADFVVRSPWGVGVMNVGADNHFHCASLHPYGATLGSWPLDSSDLIVGAGRFTGAARTELLVVKPWAGSAAAPAFANTEFVNWHRNIRKTVSTVRPANLAELVTAVRTIQSRGQVAGTMGSGWSFSDCVADARTQALIDTTALNATLGGLVPDLIDDRTGAGRHLVHVEAGIKLYDLSCRLEAIGLALPTMGGSRGQSLAGVLSTGVHGADIALPPIADAVRAIHLVGPGGQQWWIEPAIHGVTTREQLDRAKARGVLDPSIKNVYDDEWFNAVLVAMGCAGVIYSVIVECRPAFRLHQTITAETWVQAQQRVRNLSTTAGRPRFLEINVNPADSSCRVTVRDETTAPETAAPPAADPPIGLIAAGVGLLGPGALGLFFGAIADYIGRTTAEIVALGLVPFAGPVLQAQKTAEALKPVQDANTLLVQLGLAAIDPHNGARVAAALPTAINLIWAIGAFVVSGRTIVDQLQNEITRQQRPEGSLTGKSFQVMTGQPACSISGEQNHDDTQKLVESYEYAVPAARAIAFIDRLIAVTGEQRRSSDALIVNLNLRFTARTRATLGMQKFDQTCHVEIYTIQGLRGNDAFKRRLHDVIHEFAAIPHWGQLHTFDEAGALRDLGVVARWQTVIRALSGGNQMFWSSFAFERGLLP